MIYQCMLPVAAEPASLIMVMKPSKAAGVLLSSNSRDMALFLRETRALVSLPLSRIYRGGLPFNNLTPASSVSQKLIHQSTIVARTASK
jgi:hypothetical protein